ncbi:GSCOCG00006183001-RA-CDS [Cotesia congregata]|nr:GSCOCG00006183001-RA-CDS [Cotesia congregata]
MAVRIASEDDTINRDLFMMVQISYCMSSVIQSVLTNCFEHYHLKELRRCQDHQHSQYSCDLTVHFYLVEIAPSKLLV